MTCCRPRLFEVWIPHWLGMFVILFDAGHVEGLCVWIGWWSVQQHVFSSPPHGRIQLLVNAVWTWCWPFLAIVYIINFVRLCTPALSSHLPAPLEELQPKTVLAHMRCSRSHAWRVDRPQNGACPHTHRHSYMYSIVVFWSPGKRFDLTTLDKLLHVMQPDCIVIWMQTNSNLQKHIGCNTKSVQTHIIASWMTRRCNSHSCSVYPSNVQVNGIACYRLASVWGLGLRLGCKLQGNIPFWMKVHICMFKKRN